MVVAHQGGDGIGVGADHAQALDPGFVQGQHAVVFQQHAALQRGLNGLFLVRFAFHHGVGDLIVFAALAHDAQHVAGGEQAHGAFPDGFFLHFARHHGGHQLFIGAAAVQIAARVDGHSGGIHGVVGDVMELVEIGDGPAVGNEVALKAPFLQIAHQFL